jgi:DNA-binding SARP family transcriptional activator
MMLHSVAESLTALEQDVQDMRALVQQLSARLDGQLATLNNCQQLGLPPLTPSLPHLPGHDPTQKPQLRLFCFGSFEIYHGETAIQYRRASKGNTLLKYLASRPRQPVLRDSLLEVLWPETAPQIANNRLKVAVHHLRQGIAPIAAAVGCSDVVIFRDGCYRFNTQLSVWSDVEAFEQAWHAGLRLEVSGQMSVAIPYYRQAEALYRGDFLAEDGFEEWTLLRREALKDIYLTLVDKLSQYWLQVGDLPRASEGWKQLLGKDPWREDAYRHLMTCCARAGQRGTALHWYDVCARVLQEQLGLEPEPETVALYHRIRSGEEFGT